MSLRILLADESTNIKKAFHLALSSLGADIKSVPSGLDVVSVAEDLKPHIVFIDVLLTKKSGYDICKDIRNHKDLKNTPVILMWSNFMEFNLQLAQESGYTDKLEKPFDADNLKNIVMKYSPDTSNQPLLKLTETPEISHLQEDEFKPIKLNRSNQQDNDDLAGSGDLTSTEGQHSYLSSDESDNETTVNEFSEGNIRQFQNTSQRSHHPGDDYLAKANASNPFADKKKNTPSIELETESFGEFEEVILVKSSETRKPLQSELTNKIQKQVTSMLEDSPIKIQSSTNQIEKNRYDEALIREEIKHITEKICWQIIPDLAEKIIRQEIENLMKSIEKNT